MLRKSVCLLTVLATVISVLSLGVSVGADGFGKYYGRQVISEMPNSEALVYAYDRIVEAVEECREGPVEVYDGTHALTTDEIKLVRDVYSRDYAHHFWLGSSWTFSHDTETVKTVTYTYTMPVEQIAQARRKFNERVEAILAKITPEMSEFDIELMLHDVIAENTVYQSGDNAHNAYGALVEGSAVCEGYAEAFQYLLHRAGIESFLAIGTSTNVTSGKPEGHEWNYVKIDGKWYQTDVTWDDHDRLFHAYFNLSDERIKADHTASETLYPLPKCESDDAFYFKVKPGLLDKYEVSAVAELLKASELKANVYVDSPAEFIKWIMDKDNLSNIVKELGVTGGCRYGYSTVGKEVMIYISPNPSDDVKGDVNGDNSLDAKDIILIMRYIVAKNVKPTESFNEAAADFNGDKSVDAKDIILIMRQIIANSKK